MRLRLFTVTLTVLLNAVSSFAQTAATATLRGHVIDPQAAAVAGARVHARQSASGVERDVATDGKGSFVLTGLAPGEYTLRVQASGFADKAYPPIALRVGQTAEVALRLDVAGPREQVEVGAEPLAVRTVSSVVDGVIGSTAIEQLPLNGRNFLELAFLVPGNAPAPNFDPTKTNTVVVSSAGQFGRGGNITIDGADNNDDVVGGPLQNLPQDAVQEFQIATNRFSAEIGRSAASAINVVTKLGHRPAAAAPPRSSCATSALQALPATYDRTQGQAPPFDREQYSAWRSAARS